jgi:hypothetical protein
MLKWDCLLCAYLWNTPSQRWNTHFTARGMAGAIWLDERVMITPTGPSFSAETPEPVQPVQVAADR